MILATPSSKDMSELDAGQFHKGQEIDEETEKGVSRFKKRLKKKSQ